MAFTQDMPYGVIIFDDQFIIHVWNPIMEIMTGYKQSEVLKQSLTSLFPVIKEKCQQYFLDALLGHSATLHEHINLHKDAIRQYFSIQLLPLQKKAEQRLGMAIFNIISATEFREKLDQQTDNRFRVMADCAPVMLWMAGTNSECYFFNQGWLDFTGRTLEQESGVGWASGIHHEDFSSTMDAYLEAFNARRKFSLEYRLRRHDNAYRWILDQGAPYYNDQGVFQGYIGSCIDITDIIQTQEKLQTMVRELALSNEEAEQFNHILSHDLQEPIRNVVNYVQLLELDMPRDDALQMLFQQIVYSSTKAQQIILNTLEYLKISNPQEFAAVDLNEIVQPIIDKLKKQHEFRTQIDELPIVNGNVFLLTQLFDNILQNAVYYRRTEPLSIKITIIKKEKSIIINISDTGRGFEQKYADYIFLPFKRLIKNTPHPGTGLGLAICKKIIKAHSGKIWCESSPGVGTQFYIELPQ
jgi:PAS domain S-box-containing protein